MAQPIPVYPECARCGHVFENEEAHAAALRVMRQDPMICEACIPTSNPVYKAYGDLKLSPKLTSSH